MTSKVVLSIFSFFFITSLPLASETSNYECKDVKSNNSKRQICFPINHTCYDSHGRGDGIPVTVDCWTTGSRDCHNGSANWPMCAGGITTNICKDVRMGEVIASVCFPVNHKCYDPHGVGDGYPVETDCWTGGSRLCNKGTSNWPICAGGFLKR